MYYKLLPEIARRHSQPERLGGLFKAWVVASFAVGFILAPPNTAMAANVGATGSTSCGSLNITENYTSTLEVIHFYRGSLTSGFQSAVSWVMSNRINPTDLSSVGSTKANSTVRYYDSAYIDFCGRDWKSGGGNVIGHTKCNTLAGAACANHSIRFDLAATTSKNGLVCHETGHSLGFAHPTSREQQNSCLASSRQYTNYSPDEIAAINLIFY